jgi:hypothetical protein
VTANDYRFPAAHTEKEKSTGIKLCNPSQFNRLLSRWRLVTQLLGLRLPRDITGIDSAFIILYIEQASDHKNGR